MPPYIGEIRMFGGTFAPAGWKFCDGSQMAISENETLFQLIGTTYGGDGQETFNLPDLRGRVPVHAGTFQGTSFLNGEFAGVETVTLNTQQMTRHNHAFGASTAGATGNSPVGSLLAESVVLNIYEEAQTNAPLNTASIGPAGGNQPHENMQPFLCISFIISLYGVFPSQT
jgi:microcystin-dependent protein